MSKLAIFLCAVLFASAVDASFLSNPLVSAKEKIEELVSAAIATTKPKFDDIKNKAVEFSCKLEAAASLYSETVFEQIKSTLKQVQMNVDDLSGKAGVNVTDCNKLIFHLDRTGLALIANMSACIVDKLETGSGYVQTIIILSENVLANLTAIREEARHCGDNVDGFRAAAGAIVCASMAALKVAWVETNNVPSVTLKMTNIAYLLAGLQPSLLSCTTTNGPVSFYHEASTIVERTEQCIQEARLGVKDTSTSEKVIGEGFV